MLYRLLAFFLFTPFVLPAQERNTISGTVRSARTGETLIGASVRVVGRPDGVLSNEYGFYSLTLEKGSYKVEASAVGHETFQDSLVLDQDLVRDISLAEVSRDLQ